MRRATSTAQGKRADNKISIHALLAESDRNRHSTRYISSHFYPRSPCGERPGYQRPCGHPTTYFYPRSPCGERHSPNNQEHPSTLFLSTLSLRRATPSTPGKPTIKGISIHALLAESDRSGAGCLICLLYFYPRSPCGERPIERCSLKKIKKISIHALLAESDTDGSICLDSSELFLSTLSLRRATFSARSGFCRP